MTPHSAGGACPCGPLRSCGQCTRELSDCHRGRVPRMADLANVAVLGHEVNAQSVCRHACRVGLIRGSPHKPGVLPSGLKVGNYPRVAFVLALPKVMTWPRKRGRVVIGVVRWVVPDRRAALACHLTQWWPSRRGLCTGGACRRWGNEARRHRFRVVLRRRNDRARGGLRGLRGSARPTAPGLSRSPARSGTHSGQGFLRMPTFRNSALGSALARAASSESPSARAIRWPKQVLRWLVQNGTIRATTEGETCDSNPV